MLPLKGRCASNLVLCKTTVKMDPKPPDPSPQDPPNPSLLKALEAVVAAGRRGLLGPDSIPEGGGTSSNGAASQAAALSPIPLLSSSSSSSDGKKRIKDPGEKREAVITVVQPAEGGRCCYYLYPVPPKRYWKPAACSKGSLDIWQFCDLDSKGKSPK
ncbi:uncharacterized protein LOC121924050 isoform X2 [Sceloporus undulatus]|uniref:uncharacterized protein LOC121924050 isoform X2 n=1 Tax=Sceloporus undulatus TaxID=8520 RepID=UPI001C4BA4DA|nr:uncharacterized protein LOC121924050 isoform X2 [Sceloporus undulatus]